MSFRRFFSRDLEYVSEFFMGEPGLGSLFGGLGLIFWAFGVPSLVYLFFVGVRNAMRRALPHPAIGEYPDNSQNRNNGTLFPLFFWGQFFIGLVFLYMYALNLDLLEKSQRLVLYVTGLGLVAFSVVFSKLFTKQKIIENLFKGLCLLGAFLTLIFLGQYYEPVLDLRKPLNDRIHQIKTSPYKYTYLGKVLEPLDLLSRTEKDLKVYVAGPLGYYFTWPFYGIKLQNRIWNFDMDYLTLPDAFVFHHREEDRQIFYVGPRYTPESIMLDSRFFLVAQDENSILFLSHSLLDKPEFKDGLLQYYENLYSNLISLARSISKQLDQKGFILTSSELGYSFQYLNWIGEITNPVMITPVGAENVVAQRLKADRFYTLGHPLEGFNSKKVFEIPLEQGEFPIFKNERKS